MKISVNGKEVKLDTSEQSISDVLKFLGLGDRPVVVEHNEEATLPKDHSETSVTEGDRLEVVQVVAGG